MANVYYKILNKNVTAHYSDSIISGLQKELSASVLTNHDNVYDATYGVRTRRSNDVDNLLKYYVINQILKNLPEANIEKPCNRRFEVTANRNFHKEIIENKYYRLTDNKWQVAENVINVNKDGSYVIEESMLNSGYVCRKTFSTEDELLKTQLVNPDGNIVNSKIQAAEIMNFKKEYVQRYKYSGYSGNSKDFIAALMNRIIAPQESGFYMDKYYNLYRWVDRERCFVKDNITQYTSPLLIDYEFDNFSNVVRKEYTGIK